VFMRSSPRIATTRGQSSILFGQILVLMVCFFFGIPSVQGATLFPLPQSKTEQQPKTQEPSEVKATPSEAPSPEPVPLSEVAKRLEGSRRLLREISERSEPAELPEVAKEIEATRDAFAPEVKKTQAAIAGSLRPDEIWDLEISWKDRAAKVAKWQPMISGWNSQLYEDLTQLDQEEKIWELSVKSYPPRSLPAEVQRAIRDVIGELRQARSQVQGRLAKVLVLENDLSQRANSMSVILGNLSLAKDQFRESLVVAEQAPLWEMTADWESLRLPAGALTGLLSRRLAESREYIQSHERGYGLLVGVFLILTILISGLSRRVAQWAHDHPHFEEATHFLRRPVSLAFLITVVPTLLFFSENAPRFLTSSAALLLLAPLLRLLPPLIDPASRPILFVVAGFYVFDVLRRLLLPVPFLERLAFLFADLAAIVILAWLFRPARVKKSLAEHQAPSYLILAFRVVLFFCCVAFVANVLGYFDLARVLSTGTLYSTYAAFALFGTVRALSILFAVLLDTDLAQSLSTVRRYGQTILPRAFAVLRFTAFILWLIVALNFFAIKDYVLPAIASFFTAPIREGRINFSLWDISAFGLVLGAAVVVSRALRLILDEDVFPRIRTARGVPAMISTSIYYTVLFFGFFLALGMAGVDINRFTFLAGAFGVGVGFGLQNIVNNFISGLILLFERPVQAGDIVEVAGVQGVVKHIGIRSSRITTHEGADAIVPNATLISEKLMNWTLTNSWRRVDIPVGVAYGSNLEKIMQILFSVAGADPSVLKDPAPAVLFQGFGESSLNLEVRFWTHLLAHQEARSRVSIAIARALESAGVEIPVPQRDLRIKTGDGRLEGLLAEGNRGSPEKKESQTR
jgi:potassium efflux system protein